MPWFGIGSKLALVAGVVFFPIFHATCAGVRHADRELPDKLPLMRARWCGLTMKVTIPSAIAVIISGLRVSLSCALVVEVTAVTATSRLHRAGA